MNFFHRRNNNNHPPEEARSDGFLIAGGLSAVERYYDSQDIETGYCSDPKNVVPSGRNNNNNVASVRDVLDSTITMMIGRSVS